MSLRGARPTAMKRLFISYRRDDSALFTGRLFDRLSEWYGVDEVFLDIDSTPLAVDFRQHVRTKIRDCRVVLAVIGNARAGGGLGRNSSRIYEPDDPVRVEIEEAIRLVKHVVPVYVGQTEQLRSGGLPESLASLAFLNSARIDTERDFNSHLSRLRQQVSLLLYATTADRLRVRLVRFAAKRRGGLYLLSLVAVLGLLAHDRLGRALLGSSGLQEAIESADPRAFERNDSEPSQVVRGFVDRKALVTQSELVRTLDETKSTFDVFALTATIFYNNQEALRAALRRGVHLRFILLDHGSENRPNVELHFSFCDVNSSASTSTENAKLAATNFKRICRLESDAPGKLEIRWWRGPFMNSFWVRDKDDPDNRLGHVELTTYGSAFANPSFRFGALGPGFLPALEAQFEYLWGKEVRASRSTATKGPWPLRRARRHVATVLVSAGRDAGHPSAPTIPDAIDANDVLQ